MNIKPQEITIDPNNPYDGNRLFRNEQAAKALAHHRAAGTKLPVCLRRIDWQK